LPLQGRFEIPVY